MKHVLCDWQIRWVYVTSELGVISHTGPKRRTVEWASSPSMEPFKSNILAPKTAAFHHLVFSDFPKVSSVFMKSCRQLLLSANSMIEHQTWQMYHTLKHYWHSVGTEKLIRQHFVSRTRGNVDCAKNEFMLPRWISGTAAPFLTALKQVHMWSKITFEASLSLLIRQRGKTHCSSQWAL